jgi:lipopolysaccharide transport system ATP-binding protein
MSTVISVENLSKRYIIGHQKQERYTALRDVLTEGVKSLTHKLIHPFAAPVNDPTHEEFWALKDVSFDIQQGDRVGIIGRNGAGKSTLLKILSRITEPTTGRIKMRGRVASLLEVGTGFHPELTGRENIFLNGAILGMTKTEIKKNFDEIVAFAEVEKFLDTPVKRYSSGMYVRLAFAVAAHLEPDILVIDEVLAVGDAQFQKKCLTKMEQQQERGRTVLFVSHNMGAIRELCSRVIVLKSGSVIYDGLPDSGINKYLETISASSMLSTKDFAGPLADRVRISTVAINGKNIGASVSPAEELRFSLRGECVKRVEKFRFSISVMKDGVRVFTVHDTKYPMPLEKGEFLVTINVAPYSLRPGLYTVGVGGHDGGVYGSGVDWIYANDVTSFEIEAEWSELNEFGGIGMVNIPHQGKRECTQ